MAVISGFGHEVFFERAFPGLVIPRCQYINHNGHDREIWFFGFHAIISKQREFDYESRFSDPPDDQQDPSSA